MRPTPRPNPLGVRSVRTSRRLTPGSLDGRSEQAQPIPGRPLLSTYQPRSIHIPIANNGPMAPGRSTPYPVPVSGHINTVVITTRAVTTSSSTFRVRKNGVLTGSVITLPSGAASVRGSTGGIKVVSANVSGDITGDVVDLECLTAAAELADLGGYMALTD